MMLKRLVTTMDADRFENRVLALGTTEPIGPQIEAAGVPIESAGMSQSLPGWTSMQQVVRTMRTFKPDVVQTWMYHADLLGGLCARWVGVPSVVWNIRQTNLNRGTLAPRTRAIAQVCAWLSSRLPSQIVTCAAAARETHAAIGYNRERIAVIPNGFDTSRFHPDPSVRAARRADFGVQAETRIVGHVGRYVPQKDHETLLSAFALLPQSAQLWMIGRGVDSANRQLVARIQELGLEERVKLLGSQAHPEKWYPAFDILASSSTTEGFPNVVGEAMSCGVPCVATDVGDSRLIIQSTGIVVPPANPVALAEGMQGLLWDNSRRTDLGTAARRRIVDEYDLSVIVKMYESLYQRLA